jgi:hypothetical protein
MITCERNTTNVTYNFQKKNYFPRFYFAAGFFLGFRLKYNMSSPMEAYVAFATWQYKNICYKTKNSNYKENNQTNTSILYYFI